MSDFVNELRRYEGMIAAIRSRAILQTIADETTATAIVPVERGAILMSPSSDHAAAKELVELSAMPDRLPEVAVIDAAGNARPVYRPLLIYAWLTSYRAAYESLPPSVFGRWDEALRPWCDLLEADLARLGTAAAAWTALALHVAGTIFIRDAWTDLAGDTFGRITRGQQSTGAFCATSASANPEPMWYEELATLHAAASYAVQTEDRALASAVSRSTTFVQNEIEPDHATGQPWGVFAFIWNPATRPLAEQLLHAVELRQPNLDGVSLILLADALYCLRLFTNPQPKS
jgi:hypothetical protein